MPALTRCEGSHRPRAPRRQNSRPRASADDARGHITVTELDELARQAIHDLQRVIPSRYPTSTYDRAHDPDDLAILHLLAVTDVADPNELGIPLRVILLRTPERIEEARLSGQRGG